MRFGISRLTMYLKPGDQIYLQMIRRTWLAKSLILQFLEIVVSSNTKINLGNINVLIISLVVDSLGAIPQQLGERLKERLWNYKSIECFPLTCDLNDFKSRINRQLLNVLTALIFLCFFFLVTACLVVAV